MTTLQGAGRFGRSGALCAVLGALCAAGAWAQDDAARRAEALAAVDRGAAAGPFQPAWDSLETYTVPDWYLDAKFGIFIHWGVYSVPAFGSEWYPRNMYREDSPEFRHHVKTHGPQKTFGYKDFIPGLTAANYDPAAWAELFRKAGAKYIVPVAEHHDGFAMYDCSYSDWTAAKMGPKRDLVGELAAAVRKEGLIFGLSSHRAEHWWFFDGGRKFDSDVNDPAFAGLYGPAQPEKDSTPDAAFLDDWLLRTCELVDKYQPQLIWFDWWIEQPCFQPYLQRFAAYYYNQGAAWDKGVAVNYKNKSFPIKAAVWDIERGQLAEIRQPFWQTDTSVSLNSWGYVEKQRYKTATSLVQDLVDIVSKNGTLLLNIGPRPDGSIPEPEQQLLLDIGKWLEVNGEAVYGTRPWKVYGEGPTKVADGSFTDAKKKAFTPEDIRFTTKDGVLYAVLLAWPEKRVAHVDSLSLSDGNVAEVTLLGAPGPLKFMHNDKELRVNLPKEKPCDHAYTLKITFQAK